MFTRHIVKKIPVSITVSAFSLLLLVGCAAKSQNDRPLTTAMDPLITGYVQTIPPGSVRLGAGTEARYTPEGDDPERITFAHSANVEYGLLGLADIGCMFTWGAEHSESQKPRDGSNEKERAGLDNPRCYGIASLTRLRTFDLSGVLEVEPGLGYGGINNDDGYVRAGPSVILNRDGTVPLVARILYEHPLGEDPSVVSATFGPRLRINDNLALGLTVGGEHRIDDQQEGGGESLFVESSAGVKWRRVVVGPYIRYCILGVGTSCDKVAGGIRVAYTW
jgi:hypothetical protein